MSQPLSKVEFTFTYRGYSCLEIVNNMGFRCGYVSVPPSHPFYGKEADELDELLDVHGGVTFSGELKYAILGIGSYKWYVGFDCGHHGDAPDVKAVASHCPENLAVVSMVSRCHKDGVVRSREYVKQQCRNLVDQLIKEKI